MSRKTPKKRTHVPVSALAWYAESPDDFISHKGGVRNKRAAIAGENAHNDLVKPTTRSSKALITMAIAAALVAVVIYLVLFA